MVALQVGFEEIDGAYEAFIKQTKLGAFMGYAFELQAKAEQNFKADRVEEYMTTVFTRAGHDGVLGVVSYIIIVMAKYVQIMVAYHITEELSLIHI